MEIKTNDRIKKVVNDKKIIKIKRYHILVEYQAYHL